MVTASQLRALASAAAVLLLVSTLRAAPIAPLPQFVVTGINGQQLESSTFVRPGNWMLVIVKDGCLPCDTLLEAMSELGAADMAAPASVVVIVTDTNAAGAAAYAARFPGLAPARWYADPARATSAVSPLSAAPLMFGLRGNMTRWSLAGIVPDLATVRAAVVNWLSD